MHSCLSLSLLHHLEGGFCLISLCSKIFPAFLSSILGKNKKIKKKTQQKTKAVCKIVISSMSHLEDVTVLGIFLCRRGWSREGKKGRSMNYPELQGLHCIPTKQHD